MKLYIYNVWIWCNWLCVFKPKHKLSLKDYTCFRKILQLNSTANSSKKEAKTIQDHLQILFFKIEVWKLFMQSKNTKKCPYNFNLSTLFIEKRRKLKWMFMGVKPLNLLHFWSLKLYLLQKQKLTKKILTWNSLCPFTMFNFLRTKIPN